jgi:hypothetical protein
MPAAGRVTLTHSCGAGAVDVGLGLVLGLGLVEGVGLAADAISAVVDAVVVADPVGDVDGEVGELLVGDGEPGVVAGEPVVAVEELGVTEEELGVVAGELDLVGGADDECDCDPAVDGEPDLAEGFAFELAGGALAGAADAVAEGLADASGSDAHADFGAVTVPCVTTATVTVAWATPGIPTVSSTPPPTRPAATVRTCTKRIQNVLSAARKARLSCTRGWTTGVACFGSLPHIPYNASYA